FLCRLSFSTEVPQIGQRRDRRCITDRKSLHQKLLCSFLLWLQQHFKRQAIQRSVSYDDQALFVRQHFTHLLNQILEQAARIRAIVARIARPIGQCRNQRSHLFPQFFRHRQRLHLVILPANGKQVRFLLTQRIGQQQRLFIQQLLRLLQIHRVG